MTNKCIKVETKYMSFSVKQLCSPSSSGVIYQNKLHKQFSIEEKKSTFLLFLAVKNKEN